MFDRSRLVDGKGRRRSVGFSLVEVLVVVAIIAIVTAIALPNFQRAMRESRRKASYAAVLQITKAIEFHMAHEDSPPTWEMNTSTLDQLVDSGSMTEGRARGLLSAFEGDQLDWYWGWDFGGWWGVHYSIGFRPKGEPTGWCWAEPNTGWCWYNSDNTWESIYE